MRITVRSLRHRLLTSLAVAALALAGCGGDQATSPTEDAVPASPARGSLTGDNVELFVSGVPLSILTTPSAVTASALVFGTAGEDGGDKDRTPGGETDPGSSNLSCTPPASSTPTGGARPTGSPTFGVALATTQSVRFRLPRFVSVTTGPGDPVQYQFVRWEYDENAVVSGEEGENASDPDAVLEVSKCIRGPLNETQLAIRGVYATAGASGTLVIVKDAVPDDAQDFTFTVAGRTVTLDDDADPTLPNTRSLLIPAGTNRPLVEAATAGWALASLECDDPNTAVNFPTRTATLNVSEGETVTCTFTNAKAVPPAGTADLQVTKTNSGVFLARGSQTVYVITVINAGPDDATGVQVTDLLPAGLTLVSYNPGGAGRTYDQQTGVWNVGTLANGASATLVLGARVADDATGKITNTAAITAADQEDPDVTNNTASDTDNTVATSITIIQDAVPDDAQDFPFTSDIPGHAAFTLDDDGDPFNGTSNKKQMLVVEGGTYVVTQAGVPGWPSPSIDCGDASVSVEGRSVSIQLAEGAFVTCTFSNQKALPDLDIAKSTVTPFREVGGLTGFNVNVRNIGAAAVPAGATVTVTDLFPAGLAGDVAAGNGWSCSIAIERATCTRSDGLAAGAEYPTIVILAVARSVGTYSNVASVDLTGATETSTANNSDGAGLQIAPRNTGITYSTGLGAKQYSDSLVLDIRVTPAVAGSQQLTGTLAVTIEGEQFTPTLACDYTGTKECAASVRYKVLNGASDPLNIAITFTSTNPSFTGHSTSFTVPVTRETAQVFDVALSPSAILKGGQAELTFKVRELNDDATPLAGPGDIALADVGVTLTGVLDPGNKPTCTPQLLGTTGTGYDRVSSYRCLVSFPNADTYDVAITVGGDYWTGSGSGVAQVTDPALGFATGGGWYELNGARIHFGFMAKATVNNRKVVYQGALLVIRQLPNGDVVKVKSNVFEGYSIKGTEVTFSGKANYTVNGVSDGNFAFTGYGNDLGTPGAGTDRFGLLYARTGNGVSTSTTVAGLPASSVLLGGGNIQVPQGAGGKK